MSGGDDRQDADQPLRPRLFLSYTRADIDSARRIIGILEDNGFDVWWDGLIEGGTNYLPTTEAALEGADCVVVLWSKLSVDSNWVRDEAQSGRERGRLVPVSLDGTMSPLGFRQIQLIDLSGWNGEADAEEIQRVISAIERQIAAGDGTDPVMAAPAATLASPPAGPSTSISRRQLVIAGLGIGALGAGIGAWQFDLFGGGATDSTVAMAVLGFDNLTGDEEQSWFSDGLSNELRQMLARNPLLRVSAPTSSTGQVNEDDFAIGRALGVPYILRGSVQRAGDTIRIVAELAQVADGVVQWGDTFDRKFADVFDVQTEIARTVALQLIASIVSEREAEKSIEDQQGVGGTENIEAYEAFLRGRALGDLSAGVETDRASLSQLELAISIDPSFARAHAYRGSMLAAVANASNDADEVADLYRESIAATKRAIELEPALPQGHLFLAFALNNGELDPKAAAPHYARAQELAPGDADVQRSVALFYAYGNRGAEAMKMIEPSLELDPLNPRAFRTAGFVALLNRDFRKSLTFGKRSLELSPTIASAQFLIGNAQYMLGDLAAAERAFAAEPVSIFSLVGLAITRAKQGRQVDAQAALDQMVAEFGDACLYQQVQVHAQWGNITRALELLERAFAAKDPGVLFARNDCMLDPLRDEPTFKQLIAPMTV